MIGKHYKIIFSGKLARGRETEEVKRNLKSLLKLSDENVKKLFTGKRVIIKKHAEYNEAMKYKMAFETAGAICVIEETAGEQPKPITQLTTSDSKGKGESKPSKTMSCPHCGFEQEEANECLKCGVIINKHSKRSESPPPLDLPMASETFFSVSKTKLIIMSLFSWGIYEIYWFYKNWKLMQGRTEKKIHPFWRAIFAIFFCYQFFNTVRDTADSYGIRTGINPGGFAVGYILLSLTYKLPDPIWLICLLTFIPLLPIQGVINDINAKIAPNAEINNRFSWKNVVVIIIGAILSLLILLGMFVPE
jgi:hypothetical protein